MNLPQEFQEKMQELFQDEYETYIQSYDEKSFNGLRINTSKISVEDFLKINPFHLEPVPWTTNGFYYSDQDRPSKHPYYYAGLYYLQEPSAMTPASILPIEKGDFVLDTCAAPGGKSTELAAKLNGTGLLFSNDISASRAQALLKNLELFGIRNSFVCSEDIDKLACYFPEFFDKILIDAPCSGEGMFRKDPSIIKSWMERKNQYYVTIQKGIVENAVKMLKPGGMVVYSTCTFSSEENEDIIAHMLEVCPELHLIDLSEHYEGFCQGIHGMKECIRIYPHKVHGEGHFVALLQKGEAKTNEYKERKAHLVSDEFLDLITKQWTNGTFETIKDKLYFIPNTNTNMKGLRLLRTGLLIGEFKKNRFEPSQSLAMALKANEFKHVISLPASDDRVIKYLKGETIDVSDIDVKTKGWMLFCVDGFPLGFGKIQKGIIKNKYAKGWRYL